MVWDGCLLLWSQTILALDWVLAGVCLPQLLAVALTVSSRALTQASPAFWPICLSLLEEAPSRPRPHSLHGWEATHACE